MTAGHTTLTPFEASVLLLKQLKDNAEATLGMTIDRAVVTVPAYFETSAKTQTTQAGAEAGLEVAETLMEPVAAALAHMHENGYTADPAKSRRFLVYDLGGGTFDTSVVSWAAQEGFTSRSFGGNRYLGGYDFDQAVVDWVIARLPAYDLRSEPGDPGSDERRARLLALAESAKHDLSRESETEIISDDLEDRAGQPMTINLSLSRVEFDQLIEGHLRSTVDHCAEALATARVEPGELDEIVLVGGSSRIPLVAELLRERFGIAPRLFHPELVVAVGAALKAAGLATRSSVLELENLEPDGDVVDIAGRVLLSGISGAEIVVEVAASTGDALREPVSTGGTFLFVDVPVGTGEFTVRVLADGREVGAERLGVRTRPGPTVPDVAGDILAHDFSVELLDRQLCLVAKAGTRIPHRVRQRLETATRGTTLAVRVYEGWIPIGTVRIRDLPEELDPGAAVELTIEFEVGWTLRAGVRIPQLDRSATAVIELPVREVAPWEQIRARATAARADWAQIRRDVHPAESAAAAPEVERRLTVLDTLVARNQDQAKAHHLLLEAETILQGLVNSRGPADYMEPPLSEFEDTLREVSDLVLLLQRSEPERAPIYRARRDDLEVEGRSAYAAGDFLTWPRVNEQLDDLHVELFQISSVREIVMVEQTPRVVRSWMGRRITRTDAEIRRKHDELQLDARLEEQDRAKLPAQRDDLLAELAVVAMAIDQVDDKRASAPEQMWNIWFDRMKPLTRRVAGWGREARMRRTS
ncbi:Hsp70 family protein [Pseudonocardia sp. TRM90224]|uniref:Hsp70 family protein n=1 Tax=Pseudonocardia sp. TRM90224 TaxID=2812678 RepID=UPI001E64E994|nr:Hsp70 family protein [Pseudonocardia sp. TRM90224]